MRRFALLTLCLAATLSAQEIPVQNVSPAQLVPAASAKKSRAFRTA